jgi:hypothetical protein
MLTKLDWQLLMLMAMLRSLLETAALLASAWRTISGTPKTFLALSLAEKEDSEAKGLTALGMDTRLSIMDGGWMELSVEQMDMAMTSLLTRSLTRSASSCSTRDAVNISDNSILPLRTAHTSLDGIPLGFVSMTSAATV